MAIRSNGPILRQIQTLFNVGAIGDLTDAQLLERFTTLDRAAAEAAFAALVERHGPMVLRVCRNLLKNPQDAEDACQATFFILVRKARFVWVRDSLGPWLHRVARRVASRARASAIRRREHERRAGRAETEGGPRLTTMIRRDFSGCSTRKLTGCPRSTEPWPSCATWRAFRTREQPGNWAGQSARSKVAWREPVSSCGAV